MRELATKQSRCVVVPMVSARILVTLLILFRLVALHGRKNNPPKLVVFDFLGVEILTYLSPPRMVEWKGSKMKSFFWNDG